MKPRPIAALLAAALSALVWTPSALAQNAPQAPPPEVEAEPEMTGEQVLAKMASAYRDCKTYQDEGEVATRFDSKTGTRTVRKPFKTAFVRLDRFRYEFTDSAGPGAGGPVKLYVIWAEGEEVRSWWTVRPGVERHDSMNMALSAATGVSDGSAITVPSMLYDLQGVRVHRAAQMARPKLAGEDQVDGATCLRVEGVDSTGEPTVLWVDKGTFLIRKIYEEHAHADFATQTTTTYKPKVNEEIAGEALGFTPPRGKK